MALSQLAALVRTLVFYFILMVLLIALGSTLQVALGLPGVVLMQLLVFMGLPILFVVGAKQEPLRPFLRLRGLTASGWFKTIILGVLSWLTAQFLGSVMVLTVKQLGGEFHQPYQILLDAPLWLALFAGALVPAICEELSFRGYVLRSLRPLGPVASVVLTGLLFGALHMSLLRLLPLALLGALWALVVQRSGSILPGMVMHLLNNGIALGLVFFVQAGSNPADMDALDKIAPFVLWVVIAILGLMAVGAFLLAMTFSHRDVVGGQEESEAPETLDEATAGLTAEGEALAAELTAIRARKRRLLTVAGAVAGLASLTLYGFFVMMELKQTFGG